MFALFALVAAVSVPPCWDIFDGALRRSAASAHPAYVSYDERILVLQDDQRLIQSTAHVDYRDDGLARVSDERFNFEPYVTRYTEPGPPVLGPYGVNRDTWLPQTDIFPTIATVRSEGDMRCEVRDVEAYKGHSTYHLQFTRISGISKPSIKAIWVDTTSDAIWKVIVTGYVRFDEDNERDLADFEVELGYTGPYLVVNHVVWSYRRHEYSQISNYFGEYTLTGYSFPPHMPGTYFGDSRAARSP